MGKHERKDIELMEKSVVRLLTGKTSFINSNNKWFRHMLAFVDYINKNYSNFRQVKHIGNQYGQLRGDIEIITKNGDIVYIELKASETEKGKGTLANISQNAFTEYSLVVNQGREKVLSWSEFRRIKKFKQKVENLLNEYSFSKKLDFYEQARLIRRKAKEGNRKALKIKQAIIALAKEDKKDYLDYMRQFSVNETNLKKFVFCMLNGIHTKKEVLNLIKKTALSSLRRKSSSIIILYANLKQDKVVVVKDESRSAILLKKSTKLKFSFPKESGEMVYTYIVCSQKKNRQIKSKKLLGLVYHWKNIFQGIKTPCINVFLV